MTRLTFFKNGNYYLGFLCKGHSGYSDEGSDIVCSAISSAVQYTIMYLSKYHEDEINLIVDEQNALIELRCKNVFSGAAKLISVLEDFSMQLSEQYSDYFTFDYLEV